MIIDWEHHYLPEELWLKKGGKKGERTGFYVNGKLRATMHPELCDAEGKLKVMDAVGIDMAVLSMDFLDNLKKVPHNRCLNGAAGAHLARDVLLPYRNALTKTSAWHFVCSKDKEENHDH